MESVPGLVDIDYGRWQGRPKSDIQREERDLYRQWQHEPHLVAFPGGESLADVSARAMPALLDLARRHEGQAILVTAHRVVNKVILCEVLHAGLRVFWRIVQSNGCLNALSYEDGGFRVLLLNDTCHLAGSGVSALTADF